MNRCSLCMGLLVTGVAVLVFALFMIGCAQKQKQLSPVSALISEKIDKAVPAKATVKPAKSRKILVFYLCKGYYHESIPVANKAIELMGKKTGAYKVVK